MVHYTKECATLEEAKAFVEPLIEEDKWLVDVNQPVKDGPYTINWQEHKKYTTFNGKEDYDEVWRTQDGSLILVQDLEEAHCRNILRMILKQERAAYDSIGDLREQLAAAINSGDFDNIFGDPDDDEETNPYEVSGSTTLQ